MPKLCREAENSQSAPGVVYFIIFFRILFYAFRFYTRLLKSLRRIGLDDFNISRIKTAINSNT